MSGSRQISPTGSAAGRPPVSDRARLRRRAIRTPVVFGARSSVAPAPVRAAVFGRHCRALRRALGHAVGGARGNRRTDAGPGFAAAQEAQHAALNFELVGADWLDGRTVKLCRPWRYRLDLPTHRRRPSSSCRSGSACRGSVCSALRHPDCSCPCRRAFSPRRLRPTCCRCIAATRMLATPSATFQSPVGSAASAEATPVAKKDPE